MTKMCVITAIPAKLFYKKMTLISIASDLCLEKAYIHIQ